MNCRENAKRNADRNNVTVSVLSDFRQSYSDSNKNFSTFVFFRF